MGRIKFGVYKAPNTSGKEQQSCARLISKGTMRRWMVLINMKTITRDQYGVEVKEVVEE